MLLPEIDKRLRGRSFLLIRKFRPVKIVLSQSVQRNLELSSFNSISTINILSYLPDQKGFKTTVILIIY